MERLQVVQSQLIEITNEIEEIKSCDLVKRISQITEPLERDLKAVSIRKHNLQTILSQISTQIQVKSKCDRLKLNIGGKNYDLKRSDLGKLFVNFI
jgi:hypothetical protein